MGKVLLIILGWVIHPIPILLLSMFSLFSCEEITITNQKKLVFLHGEISNQNGVNIYYSYTSNLEDTSSDGYISGLKPVLTIDGMDFESLSEMNDYNNLNNFQNKVISYGTCYIPNPGQNIRISTLIDGDEIFSELIFPSFVNIDSVSIKSLGKVENVGRSYYCFETLIKFTDPDHEENFYHISAYSNSQVFKLPSCNGIDSVKYLWPMFTKCSDLVLEQQYLSLLNWNEPIYFSDKLINGQSYSIRLFLFNLYEPEDNFEITIQLASITKDDFLRIKSEVMYFNANQDFFAEPVTLYTNVSGGIGLLGAKNIAVKTVHIKKP